MESAFDDVWSLRDAVKHSKRVSPQSLKERLETNS